MSERRLLGALLGAAIASVVVPAMAQSRCSVPYGASPALGAIDPEIRLDFVRATLARQSRYAHVWNGAWAVSGLVLAGASYGIAAIQHDRDKSIGWILGGTPALWYPFLALVDPPEVIADARTLEDLLALTRSTQGKMDTCVLLGRAEGLLASAARDEAGRTSFFQHALGIAVSVAVGAVIATVLHDVQGGIVNGASSVAIAELNLWTAPMGAESELAAYKQGSLGARLPRPVGMWVPLSW